MSRQKSILTFNASVSDKETIASLKTPFQIMPATTNFISEKSLSAYRKANNPNILCHMNYITHVFSDKAVINDSQVRHSLRMYVRLAGILGTKDILIHMPYTESEWQNLPFGMSVIKDEICCKGCVVHLEIPAWSKGLLEELKITRESDPKEYMKTYVDTVLSYCSEFPEDSYKIVPDTAHMWSDGCKTMEDFVYLLDLYKQNIKYIHLNGNSNPIFKMDIHTTIFDTEYNKIPFAMDLARHCVGMGVICVAEVTKHGDEWNEWKKFADRVGFELVERDEIYTY